MIGRMPDVLLAPYLPVHETTQLGPWRLVPFKALSEDDVLSADLFEPVSRLVDAYKIPSGGGQVVGVVVHPDDGKIGSRFEHAAMEPLKRALLAGAIANNPFMAISDEEQDPNAGHGVATAENAQVWGHPVDGANSYAIEVGVLTRTLSFNSAPPDESLPPIAPPRELPSNLFASFDLEVAEATLALLAAGTPESRRLHRALDWYFIVFSNAEAVTNDVRVGAIRSAMEVLTRAGDGSRKIVRSVGRLLGPPGAPMQTYYSPIWKRRGEMVPVQLTDVEWWAARLCELRNVIVHADDVPDELWKHGDHHQLNHGHDKLIECLLAFLSAETGDGLLRVRGISRVFDRATEDLARRLREEADAATDADVQD